MRIAISQRVENVADYNERRDCLDQQWHVFLEGIGAFGLPVPNSLGQPSKWLHANSLQGIILTGGNDLSGLSGAHNPASERDYTETVLLEYAIKNNLPVLGICRGMQKLNVFFGGSLEKIGGHVGVRHQVYAKTKAFENLIGFSEVYNTVNSFHSYAVTKENIGQNLIPLLESEDGVIEAFKHIEFPFYAIMWHPEREKPFDKIDVRLFKNIFKKGVAK